MPENQLQLEQCFSRGRWQQNEPNNLMYIRFWGRVKLEHWRKPPQTGENIQTAHRKAQSHCDAQYLCTILLELSHVATHQGFTCLFWEETLTSRFISSIIFKFIPLKKSLFSLLVCYFDRLSSLFHCSSWLMEQADTSVRWGTFHFCIQPDDKNVNTHVH